MWLLLGCVWKREIIFFIFLRFWIIVYLYEESIGNFGKNMCEND